MKELLFPLFVILFVSSCAENAVVLPAKTQEGRNTVGYMNGDQPMGGPLTSDDKVYRDSINQLVIETRDYRSYGIYGKFPHDLRLVLEQDSVDLDFSLVDAVHDGDETDSLSNHSFFVSYHNLDKKILSGMFELRFKHYGSDNYQGPKNGRFDIVYP